MVYQSLNTFRIFEQLVTNTMLDYRELGTPTPVLLTVSLTWAMFYMPFFPSFILLHNATSP